MSRCARTVPVLLLGGLLAGCVRLAIPGLAADTGKPAPETRGVDADGQPFQLSDYRGRVVLLDFWRQS